jgi:hypothetical protein
LRTGVVVIVLASAVVIVTWPVAPPSLVGETPRGDAGLIRPG